jgi:hypothetical protein
LEGVISADPTEDHVPDNGTKEKGREQVDVLPCLRRSLMISEELVVERKGIIVAPSETLKGNVLIKDRPVQTK